MMLYDPSIFERQRRSLFIYEMPGCGCGSVLHSCVIVLHICVIVLHCVFFFFFTKLTYKCDFRSGAIQVFSILLIMIPPIHPDIAFVGSPEPLGS